MNTYSGKIAKVFTTLRISVHDVPEYAVSKSTSGDMPVTGLDVLNSDGDSIEVALAKQLIAA